MLISKYFLNKWVMKGKLSCQHFHLTVIVLIFAVPGIPLFETQPTYVPLYELITQFELSKDPDPLPLNHNMRFYAVSKALWIVADYAWTQDQNLPFIGYLRSEDILLAYRIMSYFLSQAGNYRYL